MNRYRPAWKFIGKHQNILNKYARSIVLTDNDGTKADNVLITLAGVREQGLPDLNEEVSVEIGYWDGDTPRLFKKGKYALARPRLALMSQSVTINGVAAKFKPNNDDFELKRTRTFQGETVEAILTILISPYGYQLKVDPELGRQVVEQFEQDSTDFEAISKLAEQFDAIAKPLGRFTDLYVFAKRGSSLTISSNSKVKRRYSLNDNRDLQSLEITAYSRDRHSGVECEYQCLESKEKKIERIGTSPFKRISDKSTQSLATQAAEAEFKKLQRVAKKIKATVIGDPELVSEGILSFDDTFPSQYRGRWSIDKVVHRLDERAFSSSFEASLLLEE